VAVEWRHCSKTLGQDWVIPSLTDDGVRVAEVCSFSIVEGLDSPPFAAFRMVKQDQYPAACRGDFYSNTASALKVG
jgi:hypothetical protein